MVFPRYLKKNDGIGVTAMSHPAEDELDRVRFEHGAKTLKIMGYDVTFTENVFHAADAFGRSGSGAEKADQFNGLVKNEKVKAIISAGGGDFLAEMLPYVDLEAFCTNPKWVQGYSDNTSLLYYLTTKADVATVYGCNFSDFGMEPWDISVKRGFGVLEGRVKKQESFDFYQDGFGTYETGLEGYDATVPVEWKTLDGNKVSMEGRLIGGCLDVLLNICGTPFDGTRDFVKKYKDDGIIWYLESFDLGFESLMEGLWKLKISGWFEGIKGFVFGRPLFYKAENYDGTPLPSYKDVLMERLGDLNVPIIMDADIGHKGPQFVMINGAMAKIEAENGNGSVTYWEDEC
ncbi:MAG: LD-carboxypeptidase [Lachnospiraceae bacterium]|nr:LD-carboxypeptidase [Lachnospiraceae bacterium]